MWTRKKNPSGVMYRRFILYSPSRSTSRVTSRIPVPRTSTSCTIPLTAAFKKTKSLEKCIALTSSFSPQCVSNKSRNSPHGSGACRTEWVGFSRVWFRGPDAQPGALGSERLAPRSGLGRPGPGGAAGGAHRTRWRSRTRARPSPPCRRARRARRRAPHPPSAGG